MNKVNSKWLYLFVVILILVMGLLVYVLWFQDSNVLINKTRQETEAKITKSCSIAYRKYQEETSKFVINSYSIDSQEASVNEISIGQTLTSSSYNDVYANNSVQWSSDGEIFAYSYGDQGGMTEPEVPKSFKLTIERNGSKTDVIKDVEVAQVPGWLLLPDGNSIVYTYINDSENFEKAEISLNKYDINSQTSEVIKNDISQYARSAQLRILDDNKTIYFVKTTNDRMNAWFYNLETNQEETKQLFANIRVGSSWISDATFSGDGELAVFRTLENGLWRAKVLDIETGNISEIAVMDQKRSLNDIEWMSDNKTIAFDTIYYGTGTLAQGVLEIWKVDVNTKEKEIIDEGRNTEDQFSVLGWSPDDRYLAYFKNHSLYLYDANDKSKKDILQLTDPNVLVAMPAGFSWVGF